MVSTPVQECLQVIATKLNLTTDQRSQLIALLTETMTQVKTALTPDQQQVSTILTAE